MKHGPKNPSKSHSTSYTKVVAVVIMPYYGIGSKYKDLPKTITREDEEPWESFYGRYMKDLDKFIPTDVWIKFKEKTKIVQHYNV